MTSRSKLRKMQKQVVAMQTRVARLDSTDMSPRLSQLLVVALSKLGGSLSTTQAEFEAIALEIRNNGGKGVELFEGNGRLVGSIRLGENKPELAEPPAQEPFVGDGQDWPGTPVAPAKPKRVRKRKVVESDQDALEHHSSYGN